MGIPDWSTQNTSTARSQPDRPRMLLDLAQVGSDERALVGGKAANLGELISAGVNVPSGFCITTRVYDVVHRIVSDAGLKHLVDRLDTTETTSAAAEIRRLFERVEVPGEIIAEITRAYQRLGSNVAVAVRSSATAEDLSFASFAGQQDTYLNVLGTKALLDSVRRCWSSLWTDRAIAYRAYNGINHRDVKLAVVVQRMVDAATAGVLFTANPVTGNRDETVVDASVGLGESVVSGAVTPDHLVLHTASGSVTSRQLGEKAVSVRPKPGGGTETVASTENLVSLGDDQLRDLASLGRTVSGHFSAPQDLEWAIDAEGTPWITQTRPITTLFPLPTEHSPGPRVYFSLNVAQGVYRPLTPMGASVLRFTMAGAMRSIGLPVGDVASAPGPWRQAGGWAFIDLTEMVRSKWGRRAMSALMAMVEVRTGKVFDWLLNDPRLSVQKGRLWRLVPSILRVLARTRLPAGAIRALLRPDRARADVYQLEADIRAELAATDPPKDAAAAIAAAQDGLLISTAPRVAKMIPTLWVGLLLSRVLPAILGKSVTAEEARIVLRGIPHNVTTDMDLELWRIIEKSRDDQTTVELFRRNTAVELAEHFRSRNLPQSVQSGVQRFLERHGHRGFTELDAGMPRWSDKPEHILGVLANYLRTAASGHSATEQYNQGALEAQAIIERIVTRLHRKNRVHARIAAFALDRVRQLAGLREMPKYCMIEGFAHARAKILAVGRTLCSNGRVANNDDVFFLTLSEMADAIAGADVHELVKQRREEYARESRREHIPRLLLSDGTEPETRMPVRVSGSDVLTGASASAGSVTGEARVVIDPADAELSPGEILVAPSTDPGWTPLFLTASGLVMEMGGPYSHGATVAREYGIPAVVGVSGATERITTGQRITVDGSSGTVALS